MHQSRLLQWCTSSMDGKNDMATLLARGVLQRPRFLGNLKSSNKKLGLQRTPRPCYCLIFFYYDYDDDDDFFFNNIFSPSYPPYQLLPQITLSWAGILNRPMHSFRAEFHVPVLVLFFLKYMSGLVKRGWCHVPIPLTQGPVPLMDGCPTFCVVQERVSEERWS